MSTGDGAGTNPDPSATEPPVPDSPAVAMSRTSPDRTVFTEHGNTDGWIATSLTVDLER